ncbi:MAG: hypothetical protein HYR56_08000 [Acidobacteria bacterium]|nr:hypothetical protein [Acidobacteriota bacterium]MBI3425509.1 hypothetical protein [Acidobacteriota bacterium]
MTAAEFAKRKGVSYRTVLNWIHQGLIPGAIERNSAKGKYWDLPAAALQMEKPKRGSKKGRPRLH